MRTIVKGRSLLLVGAGAFLGVLLALAHGVMAERGGGERAPEVPLEELRVFTDVFARVKSDYVEPVEDRTLIENAIRGMLSGLDPHSAYLGPDEFKELQIGTRGEFGGLGIEVSMEDGFVKVVAPIDDTPAQRAGIRAGDLIIRIDDTPVKGMSLTEAVRLMRGRPGTKITLTIVREGEDKPLRVTITRAVIKVRSVKARLYDGGLGYVRITHFQAPTAKSLADAIDRLRKEAGGRLKGLVLDLRNNPGGVLNAAVDVADLFLDEGLVVYTEGRVPDARLRFSATPGDVLEGAPIVVMVNGGSASAAEIVAGALQDQRRAVIVGRKTFGKGSVQTILPLRNGAALKLTTARYYTPSGRSIQAEGIVPDIELSRLRVAAVEPEVEPLKERHLKRHLDNGKATEGKRPGEGKDREGGSTGARKGEDPRALAARDYELFEALNILRGLVILQSRAAAVAKG